MKRQINVLLILSLNTLLCYAQVINDHIENRISMDIEKIYFSKTDSCSLQKECLNTEITGKRIKYHNDQWFEFTPKENNPHFINVKNQRCRDVLGVQLVVIQGIPCNTSTYKLIECVSLSNQDDIHIQLDSLNVGETYFLIVDGYLHDFCRFEIQFSNTPIGIPLNKQNEKVKTSYDLNKNQITLTWDVDPKSAFSYQKYIVYRRNSTQKLSTIVDNIQHQKNTLGESVLGYSCLDTIHQNGNYIYKIVALKENEEKELVGEFNVKVKDLEVNKFSNYYLTISKTYKKNTPIEVLVEDGVSNKVIIYEERQASRDHQAFYNIKDALDNGTTLVNVKVRNLKNGKKESYTVDWNKYLIKK